MPEALLLCLHQVDSCLKMWGASTSSKVGKGESVLSTICIGDGLHGEQQLARYPAGTKGVYKGFTTINLQHGFLADQPLVPHSQPAIKVYNK